MRISDDRYSRDRLRFDLALRFIQLEARTHTIHRWTGLTDDRIRKLYRFYLLESAGRSVHRRRGKSPQQAAFFTRSPPIQQESATLASVFALHGLLPTKTAASASTIAAHSPATHDTTPNITRGAQLCDAYEAFLQLVPQTRITFEHAVFLLTALTAAIEIRALRCDRCNSLIVTDSIALRAPVCVPCRGQRQESSRHTALLRSEPGIPRSANPRLVNYPAKSPAHHEQRAPHSEFSGRTLSRSPLD